MSPLKQLVALALLAGCAPAEPDWSSGHPADPSAPTGDEVPVAEVLREEPAAPPAEGGHGHHHHGANEAPPAEEEAHAH